MKLVAKTLLAGLFQPAVVGTLLFVSAATVNYWQAWVYMAVMFALGGWLPGIYLLVKNPAALERRMQGGPVTETRPAQKVAQGILWPSLIAMLAVSALDHRFGWSAVITAVCLAGTVLVAVGSVVGALVVIQNAYAATTVQVKSHQHVVDTGLYSMVRHPMYTGYVLIFIGTPLALGSYWGLAFVIPSVFAIALRILDEEKLLAEELPGYRAYMQKVPCRLVPFRMGTNQNGCETVTY